MHYVHINLDFCCIPPRVGQLFFKLQTSYQILNQHCAKPGYIHIKAHRLTIGLRLHEIVSSIDNPPTLVTWQRGISVSKYTLGCSINMLRTLAVMEGTLSKSWSRIGSVNAIPLHRTRDLFTITYQNLMEMFSLLFDNFIPTWCSHSWIKNFPTTLKELPG